MLFKCHIIVKILLMGLIYSDCVHLFILFLAELLVFEMLFYKNFKFCLTQRFF